MAYTPFLEGKCYCVREIGRNIRTRQQTIILVTLLCIITSAGKINYLKKDKFVYLLRVFYEPYED